MARVSLILPTVPGDPHPEGAARSGRAVLEAAGHDVEVLIVSGPDMPASPAVGDGWRDLRANDPGLASAAMAGLDASRGDILLILDARLGYGPEDLPRLVAPLDDGSADLVVASRTAPGGSASRLGRMLGAAARPFTGSTDPLSGLIGVTRSALLAAFHTFRAVGAKYSLELLGKVEGRRLDVPVTTRGRTRRDLPGLDDIRHLKRLADHRWGNGSRLIQFCVVGASGAVVDLFCYWLFQKVFAPTSLAQYRLWPTQVRLSLAAAGSLSILVALLWNFSLNRRLTFSYARGGSLGRQCAAYIASNLPGVMVSLAIRLLLPRKVTFFNQHKLAAAVVGIVVATGLSFSMSRWVVFRRKPGDDAAKSAPSPVESEGEDDAPGDATPLGRMAIAHQRSEACAVPSAPDRIRGRLPASS